MFSRAVPPRANAADACYRKARGAKAPNQRTALRRLLRRVGRLGFAIDARLLRRRMRTAGEKTFEEYLREVGFDAYTFEKEHPGKQKKPDYTFEIDGQPLFDVKDCEKRHGGGGAYDPHTWIRGTVEQGRRKFREFKGQPCSIVMYPAGTWQVELSDPDIVLGAMYGNYGIAIPFDEQAGSFDAEKAYSTFLGGGKMRRPGWRKPQNTTISALITLREVRIGQSRLNKYVAELPHEGFWWDPDVQSKVDFQITEAHLGVIVWENRYAACPLPRDLFREPYDERYGDNGEKIERVFLGDRIAEYHKNYDK